jgi:hypothetical protein
MPIILQIDLTTFVTLIGGIIAGALGALYGPVLNEWVQIRADKRKLRNSLYRELANWYELASNLVKQYDRTSENNFFTTSVFNVRPEAPSIDITVGNSIYQAKENLQIWRTSLQLKLTQLQDILPWLEKRVFNNDSIYSKMLEDESERKLFDQLKDSYALSERFEVFRAVFDFQLSPYNYLPSSRFLTSGEAKQLSLLEVQLDQIRKACLMVDEAEDSASNVALSGFLSALFCVAALRDLTTTRKASATTTVRFIRSEANRA